MRRSFSCDGFIVDRTGARFDWNWLGRTGGDWVMESLLLPGVDELRAGGGDDWMVLLAVVGRSGGKDPGPFPDRLLMPVIEAAGFEVFDFGGENLRGADEGGLAGGADISELPDLGLGEKASAVDEGRNGGIDVELRGLFCVNGGIFMAGTVAPRKD